MTPASRYRVEHVTRYLHTGPVSGSHHLAHLQPRTTAAQDVLDCDVIVSPKAADRASHVDYFGNVADVFAIASPYRELVVTSRCLVDVRGGAPIDALASPPWEQVRDARSFMPGRREEGIVEFTYPSPYVDLAPDLAAFARPSFPDGRPLVDGAIALMERIHATFTFDPRATTITTPLTRVLADRHGVCQDFAHLQIGCLRALGLPARYVSGYLLTDPPPGQPRLVGADASHAWVSVHCPANGWVDLDPTNNVLPDARYITIGWGRDYGDVSPLRGVVLGGGEQTLYVGVSVMPVSEPELGDEL